MTTLSKPPFSMVGIDHVVFIVDDLGKAVNWYASVLGCQPGYSYPALGMEQLWCGAALIVLWDITHPGARNAIPPVAGGRNVDHVCIALSPFDQDEMLAHLKAHDVTIDRIAFHGGARGMGNSIYVLDPWNNKLELKGPAVYPDGRAAS
jgi:catechol 2,3-dioxygenase-like lactoylglutathione lyase family enzyme